MSEQIQESQRNSSGVFKVVDNASAFNDLLKAIEESNFSQRDKGTDFERLSLDFLTNEPTYKDQFTKVQMYSDWAKEHKDLEANAKDIGIDLVATDVMADEGKKAYAITGIDTAGSKTYDTITVKTTLGEVIPIGGFLIEAKAESSETSSALKYIPQSMVGTGKPIVSGQNIDTDAWVIGVTKGRALPECVAKHLKCIVNY